MVFRFKYPLKMQTDKKIHLHLKPDETLAIMPARVFDPFSGSVSGKVETLPPLKNLQ